MVDLNRDGWETGGEEAGGWWGLESLEHLETGQEGGRLVGGDGRVARGGRDLKPEGSIEATAAQTVTELDGL